MNESIIESTEFVDRSLGLVTLAYCDKIRKIKMRETSFLATNGKYLGYLKKDEQVKTDSNVSNNNVTVNGGLTVPAPIERLSKVVDVVPVNGQYGLIDFHPIKLRATMMVNARTNGVSAYNTSISNASTSVDSNEMFNVGVETSIPIGSLTDSAIDTEEVKEPVSVVNNDESAIAREPIEVVPSREDSMSYADGINSAFESEMKEDNVISVEPVDNSSIAVEPVAISPDDVKAAVGSGAKLDVDTSQEVTPISPEEVQDVVGSSQELSSEEINELVNKGLNSLEPTVSKNNTHVARVNSFDGDGNYLNVSNNEVEESIEVAPVVEQPVVFPKIQFTMPEVKIGDNVTPVSNDSVDNIVSTDNDMTIETKETAEDVVKEGSNIRGDIVVVPDRPIIDEIVKEPVASENNEIVNESVSNDESVTDTAVALDDEIEDFVVVDNDHTIEKQETIDDAKIDESVVADVEVTANDKVQAEKSEIESNTDNIVSDNEEAQVDDTKVDSNDDLQFDFSGATLKDINGAVDNVSSKSSLEDLKDRITLLLREKEVKSKELENARRKAEEAEKQREAARKAKEDAIRSLDVYRQELENSVAKFTQQSSEIEEKAKATLSEADMDFMVAEEASSLLSSVNEDEYTGVMRRAA